MRLWIPIAAAMLSAYAATPARAVVPPDFYLDGIAGGREPSETVSRVVIDALGNGFYYEMGVADRATGTFTLMSTFTLSSGDLDALWNSVQTNGFFALAPLYDSGAHDGSFCRLVVQGGGQLDTTITMNIAVSGVDNVVTTLNAMTPGGADLIYNAIVPGPEPFPAVKGGGIGILAGQGTTVTRAGCTITITIYIDLIGPLANAATAAAYKADIEEKWNRPNAYLSWCPIKFVAVVAVGAGKAAHNQITVVAPANRSFCNGTPAPNGPGTTGSWRSNAGADNGAAHEAGHLMGLDDQYMDDPKTGQSVPNPGHGDDIMATRSKAGNPMPGPRQDAIESIIAAAGVTCPEWCCIFDPVPLPNNLCSVGSTCTEYLNARARETEPVYVLQAYCTIPQFQVSPPQMYIPPQSSFQFQVAFSPSDTNHVEGWVVMVRQLTHTGEGDGPGIEMDSIGVSGKGLGTTDVPQGGPSRISLGIAPNPGRTTRVDWSLPRGDRVELAVYDLLGRQVAVLARGAFPAGAHSRRWDGRDRAGKEAGAGVYLFRLTVGGEILQRLGVKLD
jgi:hypothetical protein